MNNSSGLGNNNDHGEESDLRVDFKRTVRYSQQNSKYISKRWPSVVVNPHPEKQTTFSNVPIIPGGKCYSDALTIKTEQENIYDSIPSRIIIYNFKKA